MLLPIRKLSNIINRYFIHYYCWTVCPAPCLYWQPVHRNIQRWSSSYQYVSVFIPVAFNLLLLINWIRVNDIKLAIQTCPLWKPKQKAQGTETNSLELLQIYFTCVIKRWCYSETVLSVFLIRLVSNSYLKYRVKNCKLQTASGEHWVSDRSLFKYNLGMNQHYQGEWCVYP